MHVVLFRIKKTKVFDQLACTIFSVYNSTYQYNNIDIIVDFIITSII